VRAGRRAGRRLGPERYLEVRYEELVHDPYTALRRVCDFLGEDFDEAMLRPDLRAEERLEGRSWVQTVRRPPTAGLRADWAAGLSPRERLAVEWTTHAQLRELGYDAASPGPRGAAAAALLRLRDLRRFRWRWHVLALLRPARRHW
jgi:hypothetical protein